MKRFLTSVQEGGGENAFFLFHLSLSLVRRAIENFNVVVRSHLIRNSRLFLPHKKEEGFKEHLFR